MLSETESGAFNGLKQLIELDLSKSLISSLKENIFIGLSSFLSLNVGSFYALGDIEGGAFNGLRNLTNPRSFT